MTETAGGELDSGGETEFGVAWELGVGFTIMKEVLCGDMTLDGSDEVLCSDTVAYKRS